MSELRFLFTCGVVVSRSPRALCLTVLEEFVTEDVGGIPGSTWPASGDPGRTVTEDRSHPHWKYEWKCPDHPDADHQLNYERILGLILDLERALWRDREKCSPVVVPVGVLDPATPDAREWRYVNGEWVLQLLQ